MSTKKTPAQDASPSVTKDDALFASLTILMALLPALHKNQAINGQAFLRSLDSVAKQVGEASDNPGLSRAVEQLLGPLRNLVERDTEQDEAQEDSAIKKGDPESGSAA